MSIFFSSFCFFLFVLYFFNSTCYFSVHTVFPGKYFEQQPTNFCQIKTNAARCDIIIPRESIDLECIMSRIAIISDIHSNLPALEAVFSHIWQNDVDTIYCIGDIIGKGPLPVEAISLCQKHCDKMILGNWEDFLIHNDIDEYPINYYRQRISTEQKELFEKMGYVIEFYLSGRLVRLFHAHPRDVYQRVFEQSSLQLLSEMFLPPIEFGTDYPELLSDIAIYGDIHYAYEIFFDEKYYRHYYEKNWQETLLPYENFCKKSKAHIEQTRGRHLINVGSVGQSFDGTAASYLLLEGELGKTEKSDYSAQIIRVSYDNAKAAELALASEMLDKIDYAQEVLTGFFRGFQKDKL